MTTYTDATINASGTTSGTYYTVNSVTIPAVDRSGGWTALQASMWGQAVNGAGVKIVRIRVAGTVIFTATNGLSNFDAVGLVLNGLNTGPNGQTWGVTLVAGVSSSAGTYKAGVLSTSIADEADWLIEFQAVNSTANAQSVTGRGLVAHLD